MTLYTQEGCKVVIARHGKSCWRLQPMCRTSKGTYRFLSPRLLHFCCIAHFSYCTRRDRTRNLVVDGSRCINPATYVTCCGSREECGDKLLEEAEKIANEACEEAEQECLLKCFGIGAEEHGTYVSLSNIEYCCYHRCDDNWRCSRNCSFHPSLKPELTYNEVK